MRLKSIEVRNYAGFDAQYIPLQSGVQLLVGRNNAGKSALLRLLTFESNPGWNNYVEPGKRVELIVTYAPTPADPIRVRQNQLGQAAVLEGDLVAVELAASGQQFVFSQAHLLRPNGRKFPLIVPHQNGVIRHTYSMNPESGASSNGMINVDQKATYIPDDLARAITIHANRSVGEQVKAKANHDIPSDGNDLPSFLQTLYGEKRNLFAKIEEKFCQCFPEFQELNVTFRDPSSDLIVKLRTRAGQLIELQNCGAGVEQALILLACVFGTEPERLFLIDEPHNFLHPSLERLLIDLFNDSGHSFIMATHSTQMINRVAPSQIRVIAKPGTSAALAQEEMNKGGLLRDLGYRNSDLLFPDALIFVEGPSDPPILKRLFEKSKAAIWKFGGVGFVELSGTGEFTSFESIQHLVISQEKLLQAFSRTLVPHVYLFDGDKAVHRDRLERTKPAGTSIRPFFLPVYEVENYLLKADAIIKAMNAELARLSTGYIADEADVRERLVHLLSPETLDEGEISKFYPQGFDEKEPLRAVQGSKVLKDIYSKYKLPYDKRASGAELASIVELTTSDQSEIAELYGSFSFT